MTKLGYDLEIYEGDEKSMLNFTNQGRMEDMLLQWIYQKKIKSADLEKRAVCEFTFDSLKASLSKKNCKILEEKEIEMNVIYQFELKNLKLLDIGSTESADVKVE